MKYLRKAWGIKKQDIDKLKGLKDSFKPNAKIILTRNFIYDYYTAKFIGEIREEDSESKHYFDNEILGNLMFFGNLSKKL